MGISTQTITLAAEGALNQSLARSVAVANATLVAQQTIVNGTGDLAKAALSDNSTVTLSETRVSFYESPITVKTEPVRHGQLSVSPPSSSDTPNVDNLRFPTVTGLPSSEQPLQLQPSGTANAPEIQGDLVLPGGMAKLEDVSLGAVRVEAQPQAPVFTLPILSTSPSDNPSHPGVDTAAQQYVQVVVVGSAQYVGNSALPSDSPTGP